MRMEPTGECAGFLKKFIPEERFEPFLAKCRILMETLYETNLTLNLTRIPEEGFWSRHVADSLALAGEVKFDGKRLADAGCGAGFPSLVLAAAFPELMVCALDSTRKKVDFARRTAERMNLPNFSAEHARANELARAEDFRGSFDFVTARAVSDAENLIRETAGFLRHTGKLCIYRTTEQLEKELPALRKRGLRFRTTEPFELPDGAGNRLFLILDSIPPKLR